MLGASIFCKAPLKKSTSGVFYQKLLQAMDFFAVS